MNNDELVGKIAEFLNPIAKDISHIKTELLQVKTAGMMFADRAGAGILHWMGWDDQQAFAYTWAAREMIHPQELDSSQGTQLQPSAELITFPSAKEKTRTCED